MPVRKGRRRPRSAPKAPRARLRPAAHPQGRALYRARTSPAPTPPAHRHRAHAVPRPRSPTFTSSLTVARLRVRESPTEGIAWTELGDLLFRRGQFEMAARAYRRVQEVCLPPPVAPPVAPLPVTNNDPPMPTPPTPSPDAASEISEEPVRPKVPILVSESGRTEAVRLAGSSIMVARASLREHSPVDPHTMPSRPSPRASAVALARSGGVRAPAHVEAVRAVLKEDLENFLRTFGSNSPPSPPPWAPAPAKGRPPSPSAEGETERS